MDDTVKNSSLQNPPAIHRLPPLGLSANATLATPLPTCPKVAPQYSPTAFAFSLSGVLVSVGHIFSLSSQQDQPQLASLQALRVLTTLMQPLQAPDPLGHFVSLTLVGSKPVLLKLKHAE